MSRIHLAISLLCILGGTASNCISAAGPATTDSRGALNAVAFGQGIFVAVGSIYDEAKIATSTDGLVWSNHQLAIGGNLSSIVFANGMFVAVGHARPWPLIAVSSNAVDWRVIIPGPGLGLNDITYGDGRFVAVGNQIIATSTNGIDWVTSGIGENITCVTYGAGLFVAGTRNDIVFAYGGVLISSNGLDWGSAAINNSYAVDIAYGSGVYFIATGSEAYISSNALNWTRFDGSPRPTTAVAFVNDMFVGASGDAIMVSGTGDAWNTRYFDNQRQSTLGGLASGAGRMVAVGHESGILQSIRTSSDGGLSWAVVSFPPFVTVQPISQFAQPGEYVYLGAGAVGTGPLTNEWYHNGSLLPEVDSSFLQFTSISNANAGDYQFVVRNGSGAATSQVARITFDSHPPTFRDWGPYASTVYAGSPVLLAAEFIVGDQPMSLQWQFNGVNLTGQTNGVLNIASATTNDTGCYWLVASNHAGIATSRVAVVTVLIGPPAVYISPPSQNVFAGTPVTLTAVPVVGSTLSYQWFFNGILRPGATNRTLFLGNVTTNQAGQYTVIASNYLATATDSVQLGVQLQAPIFSTHPADQYAVEGAPVTFYGSAYGGPLPVYYLQFNGEPLPLPYRPGFSILEVTTNDAGRYAIVASNYLGAVTSQVATLTVTPAGPLDRWTKRNPLPQGSHLLALADDGDRIVAVGEQGAIVSSTNGTSWQTQPHRTDLSLQGVAHGDGVFVAVGQVGTILTSSNLTDWVWRTSAADQDYAAVAYGNGRFVAVGRLLSLVMTSTNGITWDHSYVPDSHRLNSVVFADGRFVAVGSGGRIVTSSDGLNWAVSSSATISTLEGAGWGNGIYVAVGDDGRLLTSTDAFTWVPRTTPTLRRLLDVTYGNGRFVAVGARGTILSSADATTWTAEDSGTPDRLEAVLFLNDLFIAVGENGTTLTSPDGSTWTKRNLGTTRDLDGMTFAEHQIVVVGKTGTVLTSRDGRNYVERNAGVTNDLHGVAFARNHFTAVGEGIILASSNAADWTVRTTSVTNSLKAVTYGGAYWIAVGTSGGILRSSDAMAWDRSFGPNLNDLNDIAYGKGVFVIVGDNWRPNGTIWTSQDGLTWTDRTFPTSKNLRAVTFANNTFLAVGNDGTMLASDDGLTWARRTSGLSSDGDNLRSVFWQSGIWIVTGNRGIVLTSTNGFNWSRRPTRTLENLHGARAIDGTFVAIGNRGNILQSSRLFGSYLVVRTYHSHLGFEFELNAEPGRQHSLEASSDFINWSEIFSFSSTQAETIYLDQESAALPQRFYRVVTP